MKRWLFFLTLMGVAAAQPPLVQEHLTPTRAVELALQYSPDPALGRLQVRMAAAERESAASATRLKINLGAFGTTQNTAMIYSTGADPNFLQVLPAPGAINVNAMAMFPLYTGGLLEHRLQAAEKEERAAEARQDLTVRQTIRDVQLAYFGLVETRAQQTSQELEVQARREMLRLAQERLRVGKVARYVVLRTEAELAESRQRQNELVATFQEQEAKLKSLLGVAIDSSFTYPDQFGLPPAPASFRRCLETAYRDRPDRQAARFAVEAADQNLLAALADFSPKLYGVGMLEGMKVDPFQATPTNFGYSVGLVLSFPLYDGGWRQAQEDRSQAEVETRQLRLEKLDLEIQQEVAASHARYLAALANAELAREEVEKAAEEDRLTRLRFSVGRGIYLEVLDSLAAYSRARANQVRALYQAHSRRAELGYAIGGEGP